MGVKKIFFGGPTPKPEVEFVEEQREIGRAWGEVSDSEKISGKFPRVTEIYGSKKNFWRHLAAKRKPLGGARKGKFIAGIEAYNVLKYGDRGLSRTRDMVHQSLHIVGKQHVRSMTS